MERSGELKVIVGLGKTGLSCVHFLLSEGHKVAVVDTRANPPGLQELQQKFPFVPISLGHFDEALLSDASELVVSPGVSLKEPSIAKQIKRGIPAVGDIELFARKTAKPIVAITGSNGKSTVTTLVGHLAAAAGLKVKVGGNLGIPVLELLDDANTELYVLEVSSFQLETTYSLNCISSVNLNISPDHMDRYSDLNEYTQAKLRIYTHCEHPIINLDDPRSYSNFHFKTQPVGFTLKEPEKGTYGMRMVRGDCYLAYGNQDLIATKDLLLKGQHQYANALASLALGQAIGLPIDSMLETICGFKGLTHRCQWVANINGVDWYNDSKATNVGSAEAAILGLGPVITGKLVLLAGGQGKNADFLPLYDPINKHVKTVVLYGQDKHLMAEALKGATSLIMADDLQQAVNFARENANAGDIVILSPACASFDMFQNFEHRGEVFMKLVRELAV